MKPKKITSSQNYFLIQHIQSNSRYKDSISAAFFCSDLIASLEKETTYMNFLMYSSPIKKIKSKGLKEKLIMDLIMFVMLSNADNDTKQTDYSYISYIAEDIGIGFDLLFWKIQKDNSHFSSPPNLEAYSESLNILEDALCRSNLTIS